MLIYKISDKDYKYCYIGKTTRKFQERVKEHLKELERRKHHNTFLQNIYNKTPNRLVFEIVEEGITTVEELNAKEIYYIKTLGSVNIHKGGLGGDNLTNHPHRKTLAEQNKKRNIERARRNYFEQFGEVSQYSKEGDCIRTCRSLKDFEEFGFISTQIRYCLTGKLKTHKGYAFFSESNKPNCVKSFLKIHLVDRSKGVSRGSLVSRVGEAGKQKKIETLKKAAKQRRVKVGKFDSNGKLLAKYSSTLEAAKQEGIHQGTISNYIKSKKQNRKGFIWKKV